MKSSHSENINLYKERLNLHQGAKFINIANAIIAIK